MLADCCNLQVRLVVGGSLKPSDELIHVLRDVKRVFGGRFLPPSPAGIFEWVDIGRENVQACATKVIERAELCTDYSGYIVDQGIVECGRREDWGREGRCIAKIEARCSKADAGAACNAVLCGFESEVILRGQDRANQSLAPPVVSWKAKPWDTWRAIHSIANEFSKRELGDDSCSTLGLCSGRIADEVGRKRPVGAVRKCI